MKEVIYVLMGYIEDPETRSRVYLQEVTITGTPLQVATLFENLGECQGRVDVSVGSESDEEVSKLVKILSKPSELLKKLLIYNDPDQTDEDIIRKSRLPSCWKVWES